VLPALLTAFCFAGAGVTARQSATLLGSLRANLLRLFIAAIVLGGIAVFSWQDLPAQLLNRFLLAGSIGFGLGGYCMMHALKRLGSPRALLYVESLTAILAGGFSWVFLNDSLSVVQIIACFIILGGVLLAGSAWIKEDSSQIAPPRSGYVFALGAALFQAISLVLSRDAFLIAASIPLSVDTFIAAFIRLMGGLLIATVLLTSSAGLFRDPDRADRRRFQLARRHEPLTHQPLLWATANALFGPVFGVTCWLWAVSLMNPGIVQSIAATAPLISIPLSRKLELNQLGPRFYTGAPIAIAGIAFLVLC